eukprot:TRINITY_DN3080_c0_g1_i4.p2 TRINITY_DN3080_c0_g1~~TRINITY_DN3080_c0_g1_i4.p2  ORF type:complete len:873 (+),score=261.12 TRINITY_DN3080_c0_g1_i4:539-3157(+)
MLLYLARESVWALPFTIVLVLVGLFFYSRVRTKKAITPKKKENKEKPSKKHAQPKTKKVREEREKKERRAVEEKTLKEFQEDETTVFLKEVPQAVQPIVNKTKEAAVGSVNVVTKTVAEEVKVAYDDEKGGDNTTINTKKKSKEVGLKTVAERKLTEEKDKAKRKEAEEKVDVERKATEEKAVREATEKKAAEEKAEDEKRLADAKRLEGEKAAREEQDRLAEKKRKEEKRAIAAEKAAAEHKAKKSADEQKRKEKEAENRRVAKEIADVQRKAAEEKIATDKAAEEERIAKETREREEKVDEEKAASDRKAEEQNAEEERRVYEQKERENDEAKERNTEEKSAVEVLPWKKEKQEGERTNIIFQGDETARESTKAEENKQGQENNEKSVQQTDNNQTIERMEKEDPPKEQLVPVVKKKYNINTADLLFEHWEDRVEEEKGIKEPSPSCNSEGSINAREEANDPLPSREEKLKVLISKEGENNITNPILEGKRKTSHLQTKVFSFDQEKYNRMENQKENFTTLHVDFLQTFGTKGLYLISGDALFQWGTRKPEINFPLNKQILSLIWVVEKFLLDISQRGLSIRIFFLKSIENAWSGVDSLSRHLLIQHLRKLSIDTDFIEAPWINGELKEYISKREPTGIFLFLESRKRDEVMIQTSLLLVCGQFCILDLSTMMFKGTSIYCFLFNIKKKDKDEKDDSEKGIESGLETLKSKYPLRQSAINSTSLQIDRITFWHPILQKYTEKYCMDKMNVWMLVSFYVHLQVLEEIPLANRRLGLPSDLCYNQEIHSFFHNLADLAVSTTCDFGIKPNQLCDLFDLRLFVASCIHLDEQSDLPLHLFKIVSVAKPKIFMVTPPSITNRICPLLQTLIASF